MRQLVMAAAVATVTLAAAAPLQARSDREPITDPATLVKFGYAPDARDIYQLTVDPGAAQADFPTGDSGPASLPFDPFPSGGRRGTTATGFSFFPLTHTNEYLKGPSFLVMNGGLVSTTAGGIYETQWNLPNGSQLEWLDIYGFHNAGKRPLTVTLVERCLNFLTAGNPAETVLGSFERVNGSGQFSSFRGINRYPIDTRRCSYHSRVRFSQSDAPSPSLNMQLTKVRLMWWPDRIFGNGFEGTVIAGQ